MFKSRSASARPGVVTLVEGSAFRPYAIRARLTFIITTVVGAVLGAIALGPVVNPLWGLVVGGAVGLVLGAAAGAVIYVWPVLRALWHWAAEIVAGLALVTAGTALSSWAGPLVCLASFAILAGVVVSVRQVRRRVWAWAWCVVVRHRLRMSFAAFIRSQNRIHVHGAAPLILWARPTPAGERVWVWLRAGLDLEQLEGNAGKLAVACWASEVRIAGASQRHAALVQVDVTRRDPLTAVVGSPLVRLVPTGPARATAEILEPVGGLDLDDVPADTFPFPTAPVKRGGPR